MNCSNCNHDKHKLGKCKLCNCGEDEIIVSKLSKASQTARKVLGHKYFGLFARTTPISSSQLTQR